MKIGIDEIDAMMGIVAGIVLLCVMKDFFLNSTTLLLIVAWIFLVLAVLDIPYIFIDPIGFNLKILAWIHSVIDVVLAFSIISHLMELKIQYFTILGAYIFEPGVGMIAAIFLIVGNAIWIGMYPFI
ncbi:hypothetical protein JW968_06440 [Candidatus Woesearchaeota archaeon]|nr:hypothetical protein [Candidatus Woesearchaeota archaeon]